MVEFHSSVLGPTRWDVLYDDVRKIKFSVEVRLICYADDLTVVTTASTKEMHVVKTNTSLEKIYM